MLRTVPSDKQLKLWFGKFNRLWFNNELPEDTEVWWEPQSDCCGEACPVFEVAHGKFRIKICPSISGFPSYWKMILLHEMVHVKLWKKHFRHQHGKVFQEEMKRLAQAGAFKKLW